MKKHTLAYIAEAGRMLSARNETRVREAHERLQAMLDDLGASTAQEAGAPRVHLAEAAPGGMSHGEICDALRRALCPGDNMGPSRCWIADVYADQVVYEDGASGLYFLRDYVIDEAGAVQLGPPEEVRRRTVYVPASAEGAPEADPEAPIPDPAGAATEAARGAVGDLVQLVESATFAPQSVAEAASGGTAARPLLKLIGPGWGSTGYYPAEVLKRDGAEIFPAGTQNFWNHATETQEAERPEGDLNDLASVTTEAARWMDDGPDGPGLYARAKVFSDYAQAVREKGPHIGVSIRALGTGKVGEAEGRTGFIIEKLVAGKSADYVTRAGAKGKVLISEAARQSGPPASFPNREGVHMDEKDVKALVESAVSGVKAALQGEISALREADTKKDQRIDALENENARLREGQTLVKADPIVRKGLREAGLPEATVQRLVAHILKALPMKDGMLDEGALGAQVQESAAEELRYFESLGIGTGKIQGLGGPAGGATLTPEQLEAKLAESFRQMGMSEKGASLAAAGRGALRAMVLFAFLTASLLLGFGHASAETNRIYSPGYNLSVVCSNPTTPSSGDPVRYGKLTGVAKVDENTDGYTSVDFGPGVWDVYVYDEGGAGIAVGDPIYYDDTAAGDPSVNLTNSSTGAEAFFGVAMEVVSAAATTQIQVRHIEVGLMSTLASNAVVSATITDATIVSADIAENGVAADNLAVNVQQIILCGENAENGTTYFGPATALFGGDGSASYAIGSTGCDALDNGTEGTADAPLTTGMPAFKVLGFYCKTDGTLGAGETIVFTLRSAAADTTPALTCTISEAGSTCSEADGSTTDIAAGATLAMKVVESSNNSDDNAWCSVAIAVK